MVVDTSVSMLTTKNKVLGNIIGMMEESLRENGNRENGMEKALFHIPTGLKKKEYGKMTKESIYK